ncbi:MAG: hypothetical protein K2J42_04645 [Muribaculaceae bacterium]|nr:hypothetical protein [Muribaculaceae bacterium]MDE6809359.1 hypothetical protein [Muribaculaceae bacterium]
MTREEFIGTTTGLVQEYIENRNFFDPNGQLRINPVSLDQTIITGKAMLDEIEYADEAVEDAAGAQGDADESATDLQSAQDPDFYTASKLVKKTDKGLEPDSVAIAKVADNYKFE